MVVKLRASALCWLIGITCLALSACGDAKPARTVVVTAPPAAPEQGPAPARKRASVLKACDANISVKSPQTTCPFAENVFYGYWLNEAEPGVFADSPGIPAYSPAVGKVLYADCSGASKIVCRAGDGGYVTFSMAAVSAYTAADAKKYAARHALGDVPTPAGSGAPAPPPSDDSECDPNYEGACLDPSAVDYDCEGGSGDGPKYTGTVQVVGDDHYRLDRDGSGSAC